MEIHRLETFTLQQHGGVSNPTSFVKVTTDTGDEGIGQISPYNADIAATVFHRQVAPHALDRDPREGDAIVDDVIGAEYKYPWSYVCRALAGLDTALWDLRGKRTGDPVCTLLGGAPRPLKAYGSSMRRDVEPAEEAARLADLRAEAGYEAFKIRIGGSDSVGNDEDEWPGRTPAVVSTVRDALGDDVDLFVDANSAYTPERAIEVGDEILAPNNVVHYEEPCPYWEYEWTKQVTDALDIPVTGGEQDNDPAAWRRMLEMGAVDVAQPDVCYLGGMVRAKRVADIAADVGLPCVPHSANHSMVTLFAMHLLCAIDNAGEYLEFSIEDHWADGLFEPALRVEDGYIELPDGPGWGVTLDASVLQDADYQVSER